MHPSLWLAALLFAAAAPALASPQQPCPGGPFVTSIPSNTTDPQLGSLAWSGLHFDVFSRNGLQYLVPGDGGRLMALDTTAQPPALTPTNVPLEARHMVRRTHFQGSSATGFAVTNDGRLLRSLDAGTTWSAILQVFMDFGMTQPHELWDVHFLGQRGWLAGLHGLWESNDGGLTWTAAQLFDTQSVCVDPMNLEIYAIDVVERPGGTILGVLAAEPGALFISHDGTHWHQTFDIRSLPCTSLPVCMQAVCNGGWQSTAPQFEPWDVEISRTTTLEPLIVSVGGLDTTCGGIFASYDDGQNWSREEHECLCSGPGCKNCTNDPLYNDDTSTNMDTWRHKLVTTQYGVAIFDGDNSAISAGYNGQVLVRYPDPDPPGNPNQPRGVWKDRSRFTNQIFVVDPHDFVSFPLAGAEADTGDALMGNAVISGWGGYVIHTTDGGESWQTLFAGGPYRMRDVWFTDAGGPGQEKGWMVGQLSRIAVTTDGGAFWTQQAPQPDFQTPLLNAISFASDAQHGVAVGQVDLREYGAHPGEWRILRTNSGGQLGWTDPTSFTLLTGPEQDDELREVDWAGDSDWWSAGSRGFILNSTDHGQNWTQFKPASFTLAAFQKYEWNSVSFQDQSSGIFVGWHRPTNKPAAFQYRVSGGQTTWTDIKPTSNATRLTGVDVAGNVAYAVGWETNAQGVREGRIFQSTSFGGVFGAFTQVPGHPVVTACVVGEDLDRIGVFEEVEIVPATGDVAVAGECGTLVYWKASTGQWTVEKSQTDAHVQGLSATPSGVVFTACHRQAEPSQSVTRFQR